MAIPNEVPGDLNPAGDIINGEPNGIGFFTNALTPTLYDS